MISSMHVFLMDLFIFLIELVLQIPVIFETAKDIVNHRIIE